MPVEPVANARLTFGIKSAFILIENASSIIDHYASALNEMFQCDYASEATLYAGVGVAAICNDGDVSVDNPSCHEPWSCRVSLAFSAAAVSPKASPRKFLGQFTMVPYKSSSSGTRRETPVSVSQKKSLT